LQHRRAKDGFEAKSCLTGGVSNAEGAITAHDDDRAFVIHLDEGLFDDHRSIDGMSNDDLRDFPSTRIGRVQRQRSGDGFLGAILLMVSPPHFRKYAK